MNISKGIRKLRYASSWGFLSALILHKAYIFINFRIWSQVHYIKKDFKKEFGFNLNLENPKTLNEKIQWYKINYRNPLISICADKFAVRGYVADTIGSEFLIPLLFHTEKPKEIIPENLPDYPFIIKATHTAGTHHVVKNKNKADWKKIQTDCVWWLRLNYYYIQKEWQYKNLKPQIVVEKLLMESNGELPSDYKLHYFEGQFEFLQVDLDRFTNHKRNIYDKDWNLQNFTWSPLDKSGKPYKNNGRDVAKPLNLALMIEMGAKLAKPFPYVRADFYVVNEQIFFGELTFHHAAGLEHFTPAELDLYYGKKVPLTDFAL